VGEPVTDEVFALIEHPINAIREAFTPAALTEEDPAEFEDMGDRSEVRKGEFGPEFNVYLGQLWKKYEYFENASNVFQPLLKMNLSEGSQMKAGIQKRRQVLKDFANETANYLWELQAAWFAANQEVREAFEVFLLDICLSCGIVVVYDDETTKIGD